MIDENIKKNALSCNLENSFDSGDGIKVGVLITIIDEGPQKTTTRETVQTDEMLLSDRKSILIKSDHDKPELYLRKRLKEKKKKKVIRSKEILD